MGDGGRGLNAGHVDLLRAQQSAGQWRPNLRRLEAIRSAAEMSQADYAEAWLWAHVLLNPPEEFRGLLAGYLSELGPEAPSAPLSACLHGRLLYAESAVVQRLAELAG